MTESKLLLTFDDPLLAQGFIEFFHKSVLARQGNDPVEFTYYEDNDEHKKTLFELGPGLTNKIGNITRIHISSKRREEDIE